MKHLKGFNQLSKQYKHRKLMLSNMAASIIIKKRIYTTLAKAKALRTYVEPIINKAKLDNMNSRRLVFRYLQDKKSALELFNNIANKIANRNGGYTRIIRTECRNGDNAQKCFIELVDFNTIYNKDIIKKTRRSKKKVVNNDISIS
ncbi:MAG: 50S ribosomal protein L17 [Bacteroides sp.]|nr:MAG: 50S ribosomal protein L17 [Bacteroides sp.]